MKPISTADGAEISARMRAVTSGVSTGGSLALAYKLLSWVDRQPVAPADFCSVLQPDPSWHWPCFVSGIICGVLLYVVIEAVITLKWAFCQWVAELRAQGVVGRGNKASYRILS